jgi:hypothetical protein
MIPFVRGTHTKHGMVRFQSLEKHKIGKKLGAKRYHYLFVLQPTVNRSGQMVTGLSASWRVTLSRLYKTSTRRDADSVFLRIEKQESGGSGKKKAHTHIYFKTAKEANKWFSQMRSRLSGQYVSTLFLNNLMQKCRQKKPRWF